MGILNSCIPVCLAAALSLALSGCAELETNQRLNIQDSTPLAVAGSPILQDQEFVIADDSEATFSDTSSLSAADYESGWFAVGSSTDRNIVFNNGFRPRMVSVWAQMRHCNGYWTSQFTNVPPAHSGWDDMYTGGENVYWVDDNRIIVHHEGVVRGTDIHDGCNLQRFKVYAWR